MVDNISIVESCSNNNPINSNNHHGNMTSKKSRKKNKNKKKSKSKMTAEQTVALKAVADWVYLDRQHHSDDFGVQKTFGDKIVFDLHSHSNHSDGFLSPSKLVERAHGNGVKVVALTDHDTMSGIPEAIETARRFGIKIIPGVEISTIFSPTPCGNHQLEEPVHILAYYSSCGPTKFEELDKVLTNIRNGRYLRAKDMVLKLNKLDLPLKWEHVARIAGQGVAPGRLHVARAMVEAGYVENLKQAFSRYLYDGGPAYSTGNEPLVEEAVQLIHDTGGISVLAHPWALKDPVAVVRSLKNAGLHGMEVFRSDGRLAVYSDLADSYGLLKLGGSDFHGRGGNRESEVGSVNLPVMVLQEFLKVARPIWCNAIREILERYADDPSESNLAKVMRFWRRKELKTSVSGVVAGKELIDDCLSLWLTVEERQLNAAGFEAIKSKLAIIDNLL